MTNKKKGFIYLSIIPIALIVIIIVVAGYLLLADDIKLPWNNKGPKMRGLEGFPQVVYTTKPLDKERLVIKSDQELNDFLNKIDNSGLLVLKEKIDFNKEFLVAVSSQSRTEENHTIKIKKAYEDTVNKKLLVSFHEILPGKACTVQSDPHVAVDIVAVNKTDLAIDFEKVTDYLPCK